MEKSNESLSPEKPDASLISRRRMLGTLTKATVAIAAVFTPASSKKVPNAPASSEVLRRYAAEAGLDKELLDLEQRGLPLSMQALTMLEATSDELAGTQAFDERRVALLNASNRFGQWSSVLATSEIDDPRIHGNLVPLFTHAAEAVRKTNETNDPAVIGGQNPEFVIAHFEEVARLHEMRAERHQKFVEQEEEHGTPEENPPNAPSEAEK